MKNWILNWINIQIISDIPPRGNKDEEDDDDDDNQVENISDEGIDDADSDSGSPSNDYLISSVSKSDLDLMSMSFLFWNLILLFYLLKRKTL